MRYLLAVQLLFVLSLTTLKARTYEYACVLENGIIYSNKKEDSIKIFRNEWVRTDSICSKIYISSNTYYCKRNLLSGNSGWLAKRCELNVDFRAVGDTIYIKVPLYSDKPQSRIFRLINQTSNQYIGTFDNGEEVKIEPNTYINGKTLLRISPENHFPIVKKVSDISGYGIFPQSSLETNNTIESIDECSEIETESTDKILVGKIQWRIMVIFLTFIAVFIALYALLYFIKPEWLEFLYPSVRQYRDTQLKEEAKTGIVNASSIVKKTMDIDKVIIENTDLLIRIKDSEIRLNVVIERCDELSTELNHKEIENKTLKDILSKIREEMMVLKKENHKLGCQLKIIAAENIKIKEDLSQFFEKYSQSQINRK